ncbi:MAG: efflux RND transporter periplasmic adaptor subunit, partial [Desulfuromonadaceae bacterium]
DVYIETEIKKGVPSLPAAAVVAREKKRGVWVAVNGTIAFKEVTVGIEDRSGFTEIVSGLAAGERVAMALPAQMAKFRDGMKVRAAQ